MAVLDDVVEILVAGDNTGCPAVIRPQRILVRQPLPLITLSVVGMDVMPLNLRQTFCGFIKFV